jgi:ribulose-phosphate 3-epimerase
MSAPDRFHQLRHAAPAILPSLLLCDFGNLEREVRALEDGPVAALHLDVMDGQFVPNLTYGVPIVEACRRLTEVPLDVHLMIDRPERFVDQFCRAGADCVTIHVEATAEPGQVLEQIRGHGAAAGLAFNPETPVGRVEPHLGQCDLVLVMSVSPGFGGQKFDSGALDKLRRLQPLVAKETVLEIDGGINDETIGDSVRAGAGLLVVGSAIFRHADYAARLRALTQLAREAGYSGASRN